MNGGMIVEPLVDFPNFKVNQLETPDGKFFVELITYPSIIYTTEEYYCPVRKGWYKRNNTEI
jgi:hypothetical protein